MVAGDLQAVTAVTLKNHFSDVHSAGLLDTMSNCETKHRLVKVNGTIEVADVNTELVET